MNTQQNKQRYTYETRKPEEITLDKKLKIQKILEDKKRADEENLVNFSSLNYNRVKLNELNNFLAEIKKCNLEGYLTIIDNHSREFIEAVKITANDPTGEDALATIKVALNDKFRVPWLKRINLFDYPFEVSYNRFVKNEEDKRALFIKINFMNSYKIAELHFTIKEN